MGLTMLMTRTSGRDNTEDRLSGSLNSDKMRFMSRLIIAHSSALLLIEVGVVSATSYHK